MINLWLLNWEKSLKLLVRNERLLSKSLKLGSGLLNLFFENHKKINMKYLEI